jgi:hypothetical protein
MENLTSTFSRSASRPLFQQQADDKNSRDNGVAVFNEHYRALQHSPGFQDYRDQAAPVWSSNGNGFTSPLTTAKGPTTHGCPTSDSRSNACGGSDTDMGGVSPITDNPNSPKPKTNGAPQLIKNLEKKLSGLSLNRKLGANTAVSGTESRQVMFASVGSSNGFSNIQEPESPFSGSSTEGSGLFKQGHTVHNGGRLSGLEHTVNVTDTSPPKELYMPGGFGQHRPKNSRLSSLPGLPSSLGPQHYVGSLKTDLSGLVSPMSISPHQNTHWRKTTKKSVEFDLHALKVSANAVGSRPHHNSPNKSFEIGHERNITDPFVDNADTGKKPSMPLPFGAHASQNMNLPPAPQVQVPYTPTFQFPGPASAKLAQNGNSTSIYQDFASPSAQSDFRVPKTPVFHSFSAAVPASPSQAFVFANGIASRVDLTIPPPVFSSVQGKLNHTPETRPCLDARAAIRADWIRTEAGKIAELCRQTYAAGEKSRETGTTEDYQMWQSLIAEYNDATDQDKRQEERRNMFMPQGMKAMRSYAEAVADGQSAEFGQDETQGEGKLLGHQLAFMERVCAEVKRKKDEKEAQADEEEITPEMLSTLSKDEKKVLRQHLVDRLQNSPGEREV